MFDMVVKTDLDRAASYMDAIMAGIDDVDGMHEVAGDAGRDVLAAHFYALANARHRATSGSKNNFWAEAATAITIVQSSAGVQLVVDQVGVAQRRWGGTIKAIEPGYLWIPVAPESEAHTIDHFFGDLFTIISPLTHKGVAIDIDSGDVYYALVKSVTQAPDESVDPNDEEMMEAVTAAQLLRLENRTKEA